MMTNDLIKYGRLETSFNDYLKGMGGAALTAGLLSFGKSVYDYATWDRFTVDEKMTKIQNKYGENVKYDATMTDRAGRYVWGDKDVYLGPDALQNKSWAHLTAEHELHHLSDWKTKLNPLAFVMDDSYMSSFSNQSEINGYLLNVSNRSITSRLYIGSYKFIQNNHGYKGSVPFNPFIPFNYLFF
ncbi:MAG: hypothetical protein LBI82_05335 [Dysgonamonadaceae bacterium]|jgi:hypothetical protein|nr:hypothetical protein [Dysgonamonadaceae bacterium]